MLVVLIPIFVVLVPGLRVVPSLYRWRIRSRIYRCYGALLALERDMLTQSTPEKRTDLLRRLDDIEKTAHIMKMPLSFADQFYVLREHISFVRERLMEGAPSRRESPIAVPESQP